MKSTAENGIRDAGNELYSNYCRARRTRLLMAKQSATFLHRPCGSEMPVGDKWLRDYLTDPYSGAELWCESCGAAGAQSDFVWVKSGETFDRVTRRLRSEMPGSAKALRFAAGTLIGLIVGTFVGAILAVIGVAKGSPAAAIFAGMVVGAVVGWFLLNPLIYRAMCNGGVVTWKGKL